MSSDAAIRVATGAVRAREERSRSALVLLLLGACFLLIGLVDLALLWIPARFASLAWEFATVSRTLDGLPMPALGLGLITYGSIRHPRMGRSWMRGFGIAFGVSAVLIAFAGVLFATSAPAVLGSTPVEALDGVRRAVVRHGVQSTLYPIAFAVIGYTVWRGSRD